MKLTQNNKKKAVTKVVMENELQDAFMKFHKKFVIGLRKEADNLHFTISQLEILRFVIENKNPTMKSIASHLDVTAPSATSLIETLYEKKLVNRKSDPKDRRGILISATPKTIKLFSMFKDIKVGIIREMLVPLTEEEKKQLTVILNKIN
ncbi:MAG: MarR family transcriptional regulator [bacterium]